MTFERIKMVANKNMKDATQTLPRYMDRKDSTTADVRINRENDAKNKSLNFDQA